MPSKNEPPRVHVDDADAAMRNTVLLTRKVMAVAKHLAAGREKSPKKKAKR